MAAFQSTDGMSSKTSRIRVVVVDRDHDELVCNTSTLQATDLVEIAAETTSYSLASSLVDRHQPDFVFLSIDEENLHLIDKIRSSECPARIVALSADEDPDLILRCFRSGADEFLVKPLELEEVQDVFSRLKTRVVEKTPEVEETGRVIAFWGSRGGCGVTTLACNVAYALYKNDSTILVDYHFGQGDLSVFWDLQPAFSFRELCETNERIDDTLIDSVTSQHKNGLRLLLQPQDGQPYLYDEQIICRVLDSLRKRFDNVILDIGHDYDSASILFPYITDMILITTQEIPSVILATHKLRRLSESGIEFDNLLVVVNAFSKSASVTLGHITRALDRNQLITIRDDRSAVQSAINQGRPLQDVSRRGKATKDIVRFADALSSQKPNKNSLQKAESSNQRVLFKDVPLVEMTSQS